MKKFTIKLIITIHAVWTLALLVSLPLVIIFNQYYKISLVLVSVTLAFQLLFWGCPLTEMENKLRGQTAYEEKTFMAHYLKTIFGVEASDKNINIATAIYFVTLIGISVLRIWF